MANHQLLVVNFFFLCVIIIPVCHPANVNYTGCMVPVNLLELWKSLPEGQDPREHSQLRGPFSHRSGAEGELSVQDCVMRCWFERFKFAAMQGGSRCYCSSHVEELMTVKGRFCRERCAGTCRQMCGGRVAMSVYETGYEREPQQILSFPSDIVNTGKVGCYHKTGEARLCSGSLGQRVKPPVKSGRMTPQLCALYCAAGGERIRNDVAVVTAKDTCCCGTDTQLATSGRDLQSVSAQQCSRPCVGGSHTTCVGQVVVSGRVEQLISVYLVPRMVSAGMPQVPAAVFQSDNGWLYPTFVDNFDISEEKLMEEDKDLERETSAERETIQTKTNQTLREHGTKPVSAPVVYPANTGAQVVDVPNETRSGGFNVAVVSGVTVSVLIFGASVAYALKRRKTRDVSKEAPGNKTEDQEALMSEVSLQISDQDGGFEESSKDLPSRRPSKKSKGELDNLVPDHLENTPLL